MLSFRRGEAQRASERVEDLPGRVLHPTLLKADDILDRHAGEPGDLVPQQSRRAPGPTVRDWAPA